MERMVAPTLVCLVFATACGASTTPDDLAKSESAASELVAFEPEDQATSDEDSPTAMPEPSPTTAPTATAAPTATSAPTTMPTTVPTAIPVATAISAPLERAPRGPMRPVQFEALWSLIAPIIADSASAGMAPVELPVGLSSTDEELDLESYPINDGVLLVTSQASELIDAYVLLFDSDDPDALLSIASLGAVLHEQVVLTPVIRAIYMDDPFVESDMPMAFSGESHGIELLRTGADPVNDPLWMLTVVFEDSPVNHDRLRRAAAQAAIDTF